MKSRTIVQYLAVFTLGVVVGAICLVAIYLYKNKTTKIFTARTTIYAGDGIVIPKGTEMIYSHGFPEGVECLKLYIDMPPSFMDSSFDYRKEQHAFMVVPYWVNEEKSK